jgi:excisionase family DNA binding protein
MDNYLTIDQAAELLGMSRRYMRRLVSERRIAFYRLGRSVRLAESDIREFAQSGRVEPIDREALRRHLREVA